jgi:hypothetical protein
MEMVSRKFSGNDTAEVKNLNVKINIFGESYVIVNLYRMIN